jgi:ABC-type lipoprotein release transport system permease subunit
MIWKTAWKNVWRNRVRSLVVIISVTIGVFAGVFSIAFMNGMIAQRVNAALDEEISHIQVSGKDFKLNNDPEIIIPDIMKSISEINKIEGITGMVERTLITGMAGTATKSIGVQIVGIDPEEDKKIFALYKTIIAGTGDFFENESRNNMAFIGQDLAKELNIIRFSIDSNGLGNLKRQEIPDNILEKLSSLSGMRFPNEKKFTRRLKSLLSGKEITRYGQKIKKEAWSFREGSRMTLTFLDKDNNQVGAVFRLTGLYDVKNTMFELTTIFVKNYDIKRLTGIDENSFHQIVIRINDVSLTQEITGKIRERLPDLEVTNWKELQPDLAMMTDYVQQIYAVFMLIILAALAFGIVNTMLMVVLERTRELGMLAAIGMNKKKVFSMIMLESVFLSIIGGILGMFVGWITVLLTAKDGINFAQYAEGMEAFGYSAHVYPEIGTSFFMMVTFLIILTGILSSIYPALKALKLDPAEAIRTE